MALVPNHRERQLLQQLRGRGWVKASQLPDTPRTLQNLLNKRWIESQGQGADLAYRMTEDGWAAKTAPIPSHGRNKHGHGDREVLQPASPSRTTSPRTASEPELTVPAVIAL